MTYYSKDVASALHRVAIDGDVTSVRQAVQQGANVNQRDPYGFTPLHCAANKGRVDVVECLLGAGADATATDSSGWTPLHSAANKGHERIVQLLLANRADPLACDKKGQTPLQLATMRGRTGVVDVLSRSASLRNDASRPVDGTASGVRTAGSAVPKPSLSPQARQSDPAEVTRWVKEMEEELLRDLPEYSGNGTRSLRNAGSQAVPPLLDLALDPNKHWRIRRKAIFILGKIGDKRAGIQIFETIVKGVDPRRLDREDGVAFGIYRTALEALRAMGFDV